LFIAQIFKNATLNVFIAVGIKIDEK